jgi:adenosylcobinamide-phosphate synthase
VIGLESQILLALLLDMLVGDPHWLPHPVRLIGRLALALEMPMRRLWRRPRLAGTVTVLLVLGATAGAAWGTLELAGRVHLLARDAAAILLLWTTFACRDLVRHSSAVLAALSAGDLELARERVSWIVGRDTGELDSDGVVRATVESVAENGVDGVTAPLLFAVVGGPVAALTYKAINTLDSTFGYKSERYLRFGWAAARLDDLANYLPARITAPLMALAAWPLGLSPRAAWRVMWRDHACHSSPNAGWPEAAMAGALSVRLGGRSTYQGVLNEKPWLGDPYGPMSPALIEAANRVLWLTLALVAGALLILRFAMMEAIHG